MLSNKKIICPDNLINVAKKVGTIDAVIVNAGEMFPMESVHKAVQHNLINPIFIGNENEIKKYAEKLNWDISKFKIINENIENNTAPIAARLVSEGKAEIIVSKQRNGPTGKMEASFINKYARFENLSKTDIPF